MIRLAPNGGQEDYTKFSNESWILIRALLHSRPSIAIVWPGLDRREAPVVKSRERVRASTSNPEGLAPTVRGSVALLLCHPVRLEKPSSLGNSVDLTLEGRFPNLPVINLRQRGVTTTA